MKSLQLDKPHAIITIGIQGSGKTFFAQKFSETFNAPYLAQSFFIEHARDQQASDSLMETMLGEMTKTMKSVVIELSNASRSERVELSKILKKAGYVPLFVWVQVDSDTAMSRSFKTSRVSQEDFNDSVKKFSPPHQSEMALVISGKHTFATQAKAVLKKLSLPRSVQTPAEREHPVRGQIIVR